MTNGMTTEMKDELCLVPPGALSARKAEVAAVLRFGGGLQILSGRIVVGAELDHAGAAKRLRVGLHELHGSTSGVHVLPPGGSHKYHRYVVRVTRGGEMLARQTGMIDGQGRPVVGLPAAVVNGSLEDVEGAWRGAFLASGMLAAPSRTAALEVVAPSPLAALALVGAARRLGVPAKSRELRGQDRVVVRDAEAIGELLTRMGAKNSWKVWEEHRQQRQVRAAPQRLANFDDANLRRSARAALASAARVGRAIEILGDEVPEHLLVAGRLRMAHKEVSLEQLGSLADPPMTKDAIAGRIRRLLSMADKVAALRGVPDTESAVSSDLLDDDE
ncbi:protein of unknown function DUF199 [Segniliparus rotundus DSM 44985]|uniref:Probable cell division protein WhiA n=2 Tax=Segniliparus rotundus TaxID=286802 RepID=D6ZCQ4_SEGRD|nr:protein of unknown function DUF199 [Segniliparus rotundus DSM 44985]